MFWYMYSKMAVSCVAEYSFSSRYSHERTKESSYPYKEQYRSHASRMLPGSLRALQINGFRTLIKVVMNEYITYMAMFTNCL